ncbi:MAG: signal peptidase II [Clostridium sp.]|jgi:signal peptidase II|nr:signal peptidase II [Clostridium sp.]
MLWCLKLVFCYLFIVVLVVIDQISKKYAVSKLKGVVFPIRAGIFRFIIVKNPGAALGLLRKKQFLLKAITLIMVIFLLSYTTVLLLYEGSRKDIFSLAFVSGGALGNFIDRIRHKYVIDFISFNIKRFPVFNMADVFIVTGFVLYFI